MARPRTQDDANFGSDSFLDIVANAVGIVIILIMIVGARAAHLPAEPESPQPDPELTAALEESRAEGAALDQENFKLAAAILEIEQLSEARARDRAMLAYLVSTGEQQLAERRKQLDGESQQTFDLKRRLASAHTSLSAVELELAQAAAAKPEVVEIKTYPTPLSQTVLGREAHFQLKGGRITLVPLERLLDILKREAEQKKYRLRDTREYTDVIGPVGGFWLRYTLQRVTIPIGSSELQGAGSYAQLSYFSLKPVSNDLGETIDVALSGRSEFRHALSELDPARTTITIWTYADSFADLRRVRDPLYDAGYTVAARPLPAGQPIAGSPMGTHSSAQ